jgi:hypothetical protein
VADRGGRRIRRACAGGGPTGGATRPCRAARRRTGRRRDRPDRAARGRGADPAERVPARLEAGPRGSRATRGRRPAAGPTMGRA